MNISGHLRLAVLAIGVCLVLPAYSEIKNALFTKTYVITSWKTPAMQDHVVGVSMMIDNSGHLYAGSRFNYKRNEISGFNNKDTKIVPIDQVPIRGLLSLLELWPELYPEAIPALLSNGNPELVGRFVPAHVFKALTPEERNLIPADDLAELDKRYA